MELGIWKYLPRETEAIIMVYNFRDLCDYIKDYEFRNTLRPPSATLPACSAAGSGRSTMGIVVWSEGRGGAGRPLFDPAPEWLVHSIGYHLPSFPGQALFSPSPSPKLRIGQYHISLRKGGKEHYSFPQFWVSGWGLSFPPQLHLGTES